MICLEYLHRLPSEIENVRIDEFQEALAYHQIKSDEEQAAIERARSG